MAGFAPPADANIGTPICPFAHSFRFAGTERFQLFAKPGQTPGQLCRVQRFVDLLQSPLGFSIHLTRRHDPLVRRGRLVVDAFDSPFHPRLALQPNGWQAEILVQPLARAQ